ncbi:MAG: hypothetical protein RIR00_761 [Pseudomonadota bacterium]|jgi:NAD-dependent deacetylase
MDPLAQALDAVAADLQQARRLLFITGAGISADSGLPTYRGVGGLYNGVTTAEGFRIEDALSGDMLRLRPDLTWKYLAQIEETCRGAQPNAAHRAIAQLQAQRDVTVLTQNVDGLHRQAGSRDLIEIHGNLQVLDCTCCAFSEEVRDLAGRSLPPRCPECDGLLRPRVVLFGEALPEAALDRLYTVLESGVDMVFSIGTSSIFPYIVQPVVWAARSGITTVEINPARTPLSDIVSHYLPLGAAAAMTALLSRLE